MKQLYCTSGDPGNHGATLGEAGARVRAASAGLAPDRVQAVLRYAGYASPPRGPAATAEAPARLALLQAPDAGRSPTTIRSRFKSSTAFLLNAAAAMLQSGFLHRVRVASAPL